VPDHSSIVIEWREKRRWRRWGGRTQAVICAFPPYPDDRAWL